MPKLTHRTPKMSRDHNTAVVYLDGQRIRLGPWGSDEAKEAYDRLVAEWLANKRRLPEPEPTEDEPVTVAEVCVSFVSHAQQRYSAAKISAIKSALRIVRQHCGSEVAESFGPSRLRVCREQMSGKGWSRGYINEAVQWVRRAFRHAVALELVSSTTYDRLTALEPLKRGEGGKETGRVTPVPRHQIRAVRPHLSRPVRGLIALQLLTGARADELVKLRATDLDTSGPVWTHKPEDHKTAHHGKERVLYFGPRAQRVLRAFMTPDRPLDQPLFSPREANAELKRRGAKGGRRENQKSSPRQANGKWLNQHGEGELEGHRVIRNHYTTDTYRRAIQRACDKAFPPPPGLSKEKRDQWRKDHRWGPHRLRHNAATFLRREYGIEAASIILGHSSLAITQTYAEQNHQKAIDVMRSVG